jgi:hypothetical protein
MGEAPRAQGGRSAAGRPPRPGGGLRALAAELRAQPGTLGELAAAASLDDEQATAGGPAQLAAAGPRARGARERYELLVELIFEGSLLHYGEGRLVQPADPDLGLLLGDQLYALGLAHLAELGDLEAVRELADLISLISQAALAGQRELVAEVWRAGAVAIGWGGDAEHEHAKALARAGLPQAREQLAKAAAARLRSDGACGDGA